jgi:NAD(P)-dependent dehydrogenase (short-subunit alcohol dehydrogenase family)
MQIRGRTILVVGGTTGMGKELVGQLLDRHCRVVVFARTAQKVWEAEIAGPPSLPASTGSVLSVDGDVTNPADIDRLLVFLRELPHGLDGVFYCSGVSRPDYVEAPDVARALDTIEVNFLGAVRVLYGVLPLLQQRPKAFPTQAGMPETGTPVAGMPDPGRPDAGMPKTRPPEAAAQAGERRAAFLAAFTSMAADRGFPRGHAYCASKAALDRFLECLRIDLWQSGVQVFTIVPGYVETPMTGQNLFPMPGIWPVGKAVRHFLQRMERGDPVIRFPWYHSLGMRLLAWIPDRLYCWLAAQNRSQVRIRPQPKDRFTWPTDL